jgi:hypothetical protein
MNQPQRMSESTHLIKKTCCEEHKPRFPYTHTEKTCDVCTLYASNFYPNQNECSHCCSELALCWCPCALVLDILCCFPMIFGYCNVKHPKK